MCRQKVGSQTHVGTVSAIINALLTALLAPLPSLNPSAVYFIVLIIEVLQGIVSGRFFRERKIEHDDHLHSYLTSPKTLIPPPARIQHIPNIQNINATTKT